MRPDLLHPYNNRGNIYRKKGEYEQAIRDYTVAIERNPELVVAFYNRGMTWLILKECEKARTDITTAIELKENIVIENFWKDYENIDDFEQKHKVKMPDELVNLLT